MGWPFPAGWYPLKTQLKSTARHCQPAPHPRPRTPKQQMQLCSPGWPGPRDCGFFPRSAGLLADLILQATHVGCPGQRGEPGLGAAVSSHGSELGEARVPLGRAPRQDVVGPPALLVPISPPPPYPIGSCWCIWDWGVQRGSWGGHPACPWPTPSLLLLHPKLLQTRLGASVTAKITKRIL